MLRGSQGAGTVPGRRALAPGATPALVWVLCACQHIISNNFSLTNIFNLFRFVMEGLTWERNKQEMWFKGLYNVSAQFR